MNQKTYCYYLTFLSITLAKLKPSDILLFEKLDWGDVGVCGFGDLALRIATYWTPQTVVNYFAIIYTFLDFYVYWF